MGIGIKIPTSFTFGIISSWTAYVDHENILVFFDENNLRNPILGFNAGTELEFEGEKYLIMRQSDVLAILG